MEYLFPFVLVILRYFTTSIVAHEVNRNVTQIDNGMVDNFILYGIASKVLSDLHSNLSLACENDFIHIFQSINRNDLWALKVLDASGTYRHSFVWGQNAWLGSKMECDFLNAPPQLTTSPDIPKSMDPNLLSTISPIELEFRIVFMNITSSYRMDCPSHLKNAKILRLGLCLPKSCSDLEVRTMSQGVFTKKAFKFQKKFNVTLDVINVRNMDFINFINSSEVTGMFWSISSVIALIVILSVVYKFVEPTQLKESKRFLKCFSIYDNTASMFDTNTSQNSINCINGIRTCVCFWVILFHCVYFGMFAYDNYPIVMVTLERIEIQPVFALIIFVDGFFVLSALLLVFNFLKDERTMKQINKANFGENLKLFSKKIIHRYIRLTPAFIFVIGIGHILAIYIQESSSHHADETFDTYCTKQQWWNSLFYIHNLFRVNDMCVAWSWYLACDMQFYVITLLILFVYAKSTKLAHILFAALFLFLTAFGIYSNVKNNILPRMDSILYKNDFFYIQPWHRMHPYMSGTTVGYVMFKLKDKVFPKNQVVTVTFWIYAFIILVITLFVTYFKSVDSLNFAVALSFGRYFIGLYFGSIVAMCHFGYGGIFNKICSSRLFVHLNKTTYMLYLVHPLWIILLNGIQDSSLHYDPANIISFLPGIIVISYITTLITSPLVEIPFQKLSDQYIMGKRLGSVCNLKIINDK